MSYSVPPTPTAKFLSSSSLPSLSPATNSPYPSVWITNTRNSQFRWALTLRCNALSRHSTKDYKGLVQDELCVIKRTNEAVEDVIEELALKEPKSSEIKENVETIRAMLKSMSDGEISISPYDTAWVALVRNVEAKEEEEAPQFPSSLQWIVDNQLSDGSWGDKLIFSAHDRIINTLACLIALKSWDIYPNKREKGIAFLKENISKLSNEKAEHMPIGFEVAFPALIEIARAHGIQVVEDSPVLQEIYAMRNLKLTRIPKEIMHTRATTLLHSLEGMALAGLDWEKLLKLQNQDGSFLFSPASTAYALMQTKDSNCLAYLNNLVQRFNGGVPNVYPVDLFEHIWAVDRLQRLGISRYFQREIQDCMSYVYRYWTEEGICWARNSEVQDIDDTAMAFRLLRLHGYQVSADVFKNFEKDGEFFCFVGQSTQAVTGMYNLLRASQLEYPGEKILQQARIFSSKFLRERQASNELFDKWIISKDLPGEVAYSLDIPWYANLPRVETRFYIEQYGGENDVWIGKTLYRMPYVSNNTYLELAKLDYNNCQSLHRLEWDSVLRWHSEYNLEELGVSQRSLLVAYFIATATMFEPERSRERLAWAKTATLLEAIASNFVNDKPSWLQRNDFVNEFERSYLTQGYAGNQRIMQGNKQKWQRLLGPLMSTLNQLSLDALVTYGRDIRQQLYQAWAKWLRTWEEEGDRHKGEAELLVHIIGLCGGRCLSEQVLSHPDTLHLLDLTNQVCQHLGHLRTLKHNDTKVQDMDAKMIEPSDSETSKIEEDMQELLKLVLSNDALKGIHPILKQTFLAVAKAFYYAAHCSPQEIDYHIAKVLFQKID